MAKKKHYEFQENKQFREHDGLKPRKLKTEGRWKFNPNQSYSIDEDDDNFDDEYEGYGARQ